MLTTQVFTNQSKTIQNPKLLVPMNFMAFGKNFARFSLQWSAIGICMYFMLPQSSNTFGKSAVTFKMY